MSEVNSAYDPKLDRRVALKLLNERTASPRATARFSRESQAIARLSHPNVVAIYDASNFGERLYLTMELSRADAGGLVAFCAAVVVRDSRRFVACSIDLAAAHEAGLVHRDFKPQNVMVGPHGSARVMDFGLATDNSEIDSDDAASFNPRARDPNRWPGPSR